MALTLKIIQQFCKNRLRGRQNGWARRRLKRQFANCITLANALGGLCAILAACDGAYIYAAWFIVCAAFMDMCDGRIARALGSTSFLGAELDSLADAVSFCLAPPIVIYSMYGAAIGRPLVPFLGLYVCAGLYRLARFNVSEKKSTTFCGLPTTMAALFCALLVIQRRALMTTIFGCLCSSFGIFFVLTSLSFLMVSSIPFYAGRGGRFMLILLRHCAFYARSLWIINAGSVIAILVFFIFCAGLWSLSCAYPLGVPILCLYILLSILHSLYRFVQGFRTQELSIH